MWSSVTLLTLLLLSIACGHGSAGESALARAREMDELSALWSFYKYRYIQEGRVVSHDEGGMTTSEGQGYAMLRAVWSNDRATFDAVWRWTRTHLQTRPDRLLAWKWKEHVLDTNSATDADTDVALALVLASRRFLSPEYRDAALAMLDDIWRLEILQAGDRFLVTAGNWSSAERYPTIHVAYLAPYAYQVFAGVDPRHPWQRLVRSSYQVLRELYVEKRLVLPPEIVWLDRRTGKILLEHPETRVRAAFGYDSVPIFWRVALDAAWFGRSEGALRRQMLRPLAEEWNRNRRLRDRYDTTGKPLSELDGLPHLASAHALALVEDRDLAAEIRRDRLDGLWEHALAGEETPYYLHNWLWFDRALELEAVRHFDEVLGFLRPFDWDGFSDRFPWWLFGATLMLYPLARRWRPCKVAFLACGFFLSIRYLAWRALHTLNFVEPLGPVISVSLLLAEAYGVSTVALLLLQVGLSPGQRRPAPPAFAPDGQLPAVDVLVPIHSESLEILDRTLTAAAAMRYPRMSLWVCDDGHREEVARLAGEHGAGYIPGPRRHAKAGNLNHALTMTSGELVAVFDTDHVPVGSFLERTVPWFRDPSVGLVQTPHHFHNEDVFQRAFRATSAVPNEQDMFNHAIQRGRDRWGGAFFVGSGAVLRRTAIDSVGGFQLLSITEDIHTSQKLHARGWRSVFVDEDLAVGLAAENLASHLVQRRRWMLGCLQIFFRDNPLLERGLRLRHRLGYFASLWYFFFPLARLAFWATPLWFLLFHLHPLLAEVSVLLAYLVPFLVVLPLMAAAILPGWPRALWGSAYESAVFFPLSRSMLDLLLPRKLGFKVTPKGLRSDRCSFDLGSTRLTLLAAGVGLVAIAKGAFEFSYFAIEKDAYFFNLGWAAYGLLLVGAALLVAWQRPQRRAEERVPRALPVVVEGGGTELLATTTDASPAGIAVHLERHAPLPADVVVRIGKREPLRLQARVVYSERAGRRLRCGLAFTGVGVAERRSLTRLLFSDPAAWSAAHDGRARSNLKMALRFAGGVVSAFAPLRPRRRMHPRRRAFRWLRLVAPGRSAPALVTNASPGGFGLLVLGREPPPKDPLPILDAGGRTQWVRVVRCRQTAPLVWRVGLALMEPTGPATARAYLAA
jgi:cellulose synthase (UDP-forming)